MTQGNRTAFNIACVSGAAMLQIVIQFLFFRVLAGTFAATGPADALAAALALPTVFTAIITGSLSYVLIPELVRKFESEEDESSAWQLASYVGSVTIAISALTSVILYFGAPTICVRLYPAMAEHDQQLTIQLLRILSGQVVLTGLISWAQAIHHSRHHFLIPALGGVLGTGLQLCLAEWLGARHISFFAWAINAGSLVSVLVHLLPLVRQLGAPRSDQESLWRLLAMFWPLLVGSAFIRLNPLVDRVLAAESELGEGSIAYINYSQRIMMALLAIGSSSLSIIAFPQVAQQLSKLGHAGFASHCALWIRRLLLLVTPVSIGVSVFAAQIIGDVLQRKNFTADDTQMVAALIVAMMGMFVGASLSELLARCFYVLGDTKTPTIVGVITLFLGLGIKLLLFPSLDIRGIAIGTSAYFVMTTLVMAILLAVRVGWSIFELSPLYLAQSLLATTIACVCCQLIYAYSLGGTFVAAPVGAVSYGVGLLLVRNHDAWQMLGAIKNRVFSRSRP